MAGNARKRVADPIGPVLASRHLRQTAPSRHGDGLEGVDIYRSHRIVAANVTMAR
jgi:hypothetical protein